MFSIAAPCAGSSCVEKSREHSSAPSTPSSHMAVERGSAASALHLHHDLHVAGYNQVLLVVQVKLSKGALGVVVQVVLT